MRVTLEVRTKFPDLICGQAAALCTGYEGDPIKALRGALRCGYESVAEHAAFTFLIEGISRVTLAGTGWPASPYRASGIAGQRARPRSRLTVLQRMKPWTTSWQRKKPAGRRTTP